MVVPGLSHWQHPRFFGYFPSNGLLASVLGDYVSTGLGVLGLSWQSSPALTELEEVVTDWMRQMLGLAGRLERRHPGHRVDQHAGRADLRARADDRTTRWRAAACRREPQPLIVYASAHSHSSVDKAALLAGFGRDNIRHIPHDDAYAMRPDALEEAIAARSPRRRAARAPSSPPSGTTTTTALDPVEAIAALRAGTGSGCTSTRRWPVGDDPARMPLDVGRHRGRGLAGAQPAQVAGRGVRLLASITCATPSIWSA